MDALRAIRARTTLRLAPLACAAVLVPAASASAAAFAPQLQVNFNPATPGAPAAITATQTQQLGETPARTVIVSFPAGFAPHAGAAATICTPDPEGPLRCPPTSQIGTATADVYAFGYTPTFQGFVYFGGPIPGKIGSIRLLILLLNDQFGEQQIEATAQLRPDGGYDNVFDNLPNVLVTSFTLSLQGGNLALLETPQKCGNYTLNAQFISQQQETYTSSQALPIGCKPAAPAKPRVSAARFSRTGVASFTLSKASKVTVTVTRSGKRVKRRTVQGRKGANKVKMGTLRAGSYTVTMAAAGGNTVRRTVKIS